MKKWEDVKKKITALSQEEIAAIEAKARADAELLLSPCPVCSGALELTTQSSVGSIEDAIYAVHCTECGYTD